MDWRLHANPANIIQKDLEVALAAHKPCGFSQLIVCPRALTMKCALCREEKTLSQSHVFPEFLYDELYDEHHRYNTLSILPDKRDLLTQSGMKEELLCYDCEQQLSRHEDYAARALRKLKQRIRSTASHGYFLHQGLDYARFKLFLLSLLWRAGVARQSFFANVQLGVQQEVLRIMLRANNPGRDVAGVQRHPVRAADGHSLGRPAAGDGLWQRHDLLAAPAGVAAGRGLGGAASHPARAAARIRPDRLGAGQRRQRQRGVPPGGQAVGPNPTDRGKGGSKRHLMVDARGTPLALTVTGANAHDVTALTATVDALAPVPGLPGPPPAPPRRPARRQGLRRPPCPRRPAPARHHAAHPPPGHHHRRPARPPPLGGRAHPRLVQWLRQAPYPLRALARHPPRPAQPRRRRHLPAGCDAVLLAALRIMLRANNPGRDVFFPCLFYGLSHAPGEISALMIPPRPIPLPRHEVIEIVVPGMHLVFYINAREDTSISRAALQSDGSLAVMVKSPFELVPLRNFFQEYERQGRTTPLSISSPKRRRGQRGGKGPRRHV